jgi:hypothetical protein
MPVVAAEGIDAGAVPEPPQCENRLVTVRKLPAAGRGPPAPLGGEQAGQVANQSRAGLHYGSRSHLVRHLHGGCRLS